MTTAKSVRNVSRRRFVTLVAAGSAALVAAPALAAPAVRRAPKTASKGKAAAHTAPAPDATRAIARAREATRATVATIRAHRLPPGGDLSVVFVPLRNDRKGR